MTSQIVEVMNGHLQCPISEGGLTDIWHRLAGIFEPWYLQIQNICLNLPVLHMDETSWKNGRFERLVVVRGGWRCDVLLDSFVAGSRSAQCVFCRGISGASLHHHRPTPTPPPNHDFHRLKGYEVTSTARIGPEYDLPSVMAATHPTAQGRI